ncbi:hypothetical protein H1C71_042208, partial [Ictidomys tridecemlineatus]
MTFRPPLPGGWEDQTLANGRAQCLASISSVCVCVVCKCVCVCESNSRGAQPVEGILLKMCPSSLEVLGFAGVHRPHGGRGRESWHGLVAADGRRLMYLLLPNK